MFNNIGKKIKILAQVACWVGIAGSVISAVICIALELAWIGLIVLLVGGLSSWIGSFFTYGLGQLIENSDTLVKTVNQNNA